METNQSERVRLCFREFMLKELESEQKKRISLNELIKKYDGNLSRRAYQKALRSLEKEGKIALERHEQLWIRRYWFRSDEMRTPANASFEQANREHIHSTHRIKLSIPYSGEQPKAGGFIRKFGRTRQQEQVIYKNYIPGITITTFKRKLNVWVHHPPGVKTQEQIINAKALGFRALVQFAKQHNIKLERTALDQVILSHHVVEHPELNEVLSPLIKENEQEIKDRIGTKICPSSHKGKIEHEGNERIKGLTVAEGLEYLVRDFPGQFGIVVKNFDYYNANIKKHLEVMDEMSETLKMIRNELKQGRT